MVVGSIELEPVPDAVGLLCDYAEAYPAVTDEEWEPYRPLYPQLFSDVSWRLPCTCHVVRSAGTTILVDTGVGPPGLWGDWTAEDEGLLPAALDAVGVGRREIDVVFLTHLHIDHLGWNTDFEGVPLFPRARYVVHADALAAVMSRRDEPHIRRCIEPLLGTFDEIDGDSEIAAGVVAFTAPGHSPGHMGLRISSDGAGATILADAVPHPAQLDRPDWDFAFDDDPVESTKTRAALVEELVRGDDLVVCGHFPGTGIGRIASRDGRTVWEESS
jgi:glyoxylase-like metal-dependent hydrolase (beta-lactamase superfamily II)